MVRGTDFLTCGGCQLEFPLSNIVIFMKHKYGCSNTEIVEAEQVIDQYTCFTCPKTFSAAISLLQHAQYQHHLSVFREMKSTVSRKKSEDLSAETFSNDLTNTVGEPLEKCCAAVVPKKRKRHIETKHKIRNKARPNSTSNDIYIDLNQESMDTLEITPYSSGSQIQLEPGRTFTIPMSSQTNDEEKHYLGISYQSSDLQDSPAVTTSATSNTTKLVTAQSNHPSTSLYTPFSGQDQKTSTMNIIMSRPRHPNGDSRKKSDTADGKPFKCDHCDNSFNQRIHLKKHLSKHTGVKPFKCGQCNYATVERSHLKVHIRIHTGEKPFKCHHCEYATAQNSTLKIHLKRHHGSLLLECLDCAELNKTSTLSDTAHSIEPPLILNATSLNDG